MKKYLFGLAIVAVALVSCSVPAVSKEKMGDGESNFELYPCVLNWAVYDVSLYLTSPDF